MTYPSNSQSVAHDQIRAFVERILRMKEEARAINDDIREIYAEAKGNGFDKTILGQVVSYVEKRRKDPAAFAERSALFELYIQALGESGTVDALAHTHEDEIAAVEKKPSRLAHNQKIAGASPAPATSVEAHEEGAADGESPSPEADGQPAATAGGEDVATSASRPIQTAMAASPGSGLRADVDALGSDVEPVAPSPEALLGLMEKTNSRSGTPPVDTHLRNSKGIRKPEGCQHLERCRVAGWKERCFTCEAAFVKAHADAEGQMA